MKSLIPLLLLFFSISGFSQAKKEIKVDKNKITQSKTLQDFISDIPKDCKVISYALSANISGNLKEFTCMGEGVVPELKSIISRKEKGEWFFIENLKTSCQKSHSVNYKIILE